MVPDAMILVFWMLSFKPTFLLSSFIFMRRLFSSSTLSPIRVLYLHQFSLVQSLSCVQLFGTPWVTASQASLSITNSQSLIKLMFESMMPSSHLILCRPLLILCSPLLLLLPIPPSIRYAMTPPLRQKVKRNSKASWWKWKRRVKKLA